MQHIKRNSWLTLILCLGFGLFIIADTITFPSARGQGFGQGPGFYPQVLAWLLILLGILVPVQDIRDGNAKSAGPSKVERDSIDSGNGLLVILVLVTCLIATFAMEYCGFIISGFLLTLVTVRLIRGGFQRVFWGGDVGFSVAIIALAYVIFEVFIGIHLPQSIFLG